MKLYTEIEDIVADVNAGKLDLTQIIKEYEDRIDTLTAEYEVVERQATAPFITHIEELEEKNNTLKEEYKDQEIKISTLTKEVASLKEKVLYRENKIRSLVANASKDDLGVVLE
jgi:FtsZ-binding cell division protein ZapB